MTILEPFFVLLVGYLAFAAVLSLAASPLRRHMVAVAEDLLADERLDGEAHEFIDRLLDTCMSFRVGLRLPLAIVGGIVDDLLRLPRNVTPKSRQGLIDDPRYHSVVLMYFASVLAANPIAALLTIPLMIVGMAIHVLMRENNLKVAMEEPLLTASDLPPLQGRALAA